MNSAVPNTAKLQRDWLRRLPGWTGVSLSAIAATIGVARTTLTNKVNRRDAGISVLRQDIVDKIVQQFGVPRPEQLAGGDDAAAAPAVRAGGFREEFAAFDHSAPGTDPRLRQIVEVLLRDRPGAAARTILTRAFEEIGYRAGDVVIFDVNQQPASGDLVYANIYRASGGADTVLRIFQVAGPVRLLLPAESSAQPLLIDDEHVKVMAVVTDVVRLKRRNGTAIRAAA